MPTQPPDETKISLFETLNDIAKLDSIFSSGYDDSIDRSVTQVLTLGFYNDCCMKLGRTLGANGNDLRFSILSTHVRQIGRTLIAPHDFPLEFYHHHIAQAPIQQLWGSTDTQNRQNFVQALFDCWKNLQHTQRIDYGQHLAIGRYLRFALKHRPEILDPLIFDVLFGANAPNPNWLLLAFNEQIQRDSKLSNLLDEFDAAFSMLSVRVLIHADECESSADEDTRIQFWNRTKNPIDRSSVIYHDTILDNARHSLGSGENRLQCHNLEGIAAMYVEFEIGKLSVDSYPELAGLMGAADGNSNVVQIDNDVYFLSPKLKAWSWLFNETAGRSMVTQVQNSLGTLYADNDEPVVANFLMHSLTDAALKCLEFAKTDLDSSDRQGLQIDALPQDSTPNIGDVFLVYVPHKTTVRVTSKYSPNNCQFECSPIAT